MAKYTYQAGAKWPEYGLIDLTNYTNPTDAIATIMNQIRAYQSEGDYEHANELIQQYSEQLKNCSFDSAAVNKYVEELRNLEIYTKARKQQIFYGPEQEASVYLVPDDVWIGDATQTDGEIVSEGDATPSDVLSGVSFTSESGIHQIGTMPNNGSIQEQITVGQTYIIPQGFHDGSGTITAVSSSLPDSSSTGSGVADLGIYKTNGHYGYRNEIDVSGVNYVKFDINVPTVQTDTISIKNGSNVVNLQYPINGLIYVYGYNKTGGTSKYYMFKAKNVEGAWMSVKTNASDTEKCNITNITEKSFTIKWPNATSFTYVVW